MILNYVIINVVILAVHCCAVWMMRFVNPDYTLSGYKKDSMTSSESEDNASGEKTELESEKSETKIEDSGATGIIEGVPRELVEQLEIPEDDSQESDKKYDSAWKGKKISDVIGDNLGFVLSMFLLDILLMNFVEFFYGNSLVFNIKLTVLLAFLWPIAYIDYYTKRIPNDILKLLLGARIILLIPEFVVVSDLKQLLLSMAVAAALVLITSIACSLLMKNSIGMGDVKLLLIMALYLGLEGIGISVFFVLLASFVISVKLLVTKKVGRKDYIPFAPSILIGTFLAIFMTGI